METKERDSMTSQDAVLAHIKQYLISNKDKHIDRIRCLISQPSISESKQGVHDCAKLLVESFRQLGCQEAELLENRNGLPGVWAYYNANAKKTIASYSNFDTRPIVQPEKWFSDPYGGTIAQLPRIGKVMIGRGARAYKGPFAAWLNALEAVIAVRGTLPVNVLFLAEGDELLGSPSYRDMFDRYRERLISVDANLSPGICPMMGDAFALAMGYKTFISLRLRVCASHWGRGPKSGPAHAMARAVIDSPAWRLVHALASLTDEYGQFERGKGFLDQSRPADEVEREQILDTRRKAGGRPFGDRTWQELLPGCMAADVSMPGYTDDEIFTNYYYGSSINISSLKSGFLGPGTRADTIPNTATCRLDIRLPRGSKADPAVAALKRHLDRHGFDEVELEVLGAHDSYINRPDSHLAQAIRRSFHESGFKLIETPCSAGGGPWALFANELGVPSFRDVGVGSGGNVGLPNEYLVIESAEGHPGLVECELMHARVLLTYGESE